MILGVGLYIKANELHFPALTMAVARHLAASWCHLLSPQRRAAAEAAASKMGRAQLQIHIGF